MIGRGTDIRGTVIVGGHGAVGVPGHSGFRGRRFRGGHQRPMASRCTTAGALWPAQLSPHWGSVPGLSRFQGTGTLRGIV
jgi:hypothetical protein